MGIFNINNIYPVTSNNFSISIINYTTVLTFNDGSKLYDVDSYLELVPDLYSLTFNSVLIGGLGLGVIPQHIAENSSCETIDVVEIDPYLISTIQNYGILDNKINVIEGDIFSYIPVQNYDLILLDIWFNADENFNTVVDTLRTKYNSYLSTNGTLYIPIYRPNDLYPKI